MVVYIAIAVIVVVAAMFFYRKKRKKKMPAGLQIFDENGKLTFDLANQTTYILGTGSTNAQNGSISNSKITARTWVLITSCPADGVIPYFTIKQGEISWQYLSTTASPSPKNVTFMYGSY